MINGYKVISKWTNADSGSAEWCFARKGNRDYFVKRFLSPVFPDDGIVMPPDLRRRKEARFRSFRRRKEELYQKIAEASNGNLVLMEELFQDGNHLYMSSQRVLWDDTSITAMARLFPEDQLTIIKSLVNSIKRLHDVGVVHADLRPENILLKETVPGYYAMKIIDFDNSFIVSSPPPNPDSFSLDPVYAAPESIRFLYGEPLVLGKAIDVYALGLLIHLMLTGKLPEFDRSKHAYIGAALNDGEQLKPSPLLEGEWEKVIGSMLSADPEKRPGMTEIFNIFVKPLPGSDGEGMRASRPETRKGGETADGKMARQNRWRAAPGDLSNPW